MSRLFGARTYAGAYLALTLGACAAPQVGPPCPIPDKADEAGRAAAIQKCFGGPSEMPFDFSKKKDVDILFMIDNSPSMTPKQEALANNFPKFIDYIEKLDTGYHVGIITSDVGSRVAESQPWGNPRYADCDTFSGDDGVLQAKACNSRVGVSNDAKKACFDGIKGLCPDPTQLPTDGKRYIEKINGKANVASPAKAFQCMALVGDSGCGMESPLEAVKRALDGHRAENSGFLRGKNAVLAVIFITDEDDCSIQASRRSEANPNTVDCTNPDQNASYECYNIDYRCVARSVQCDEPMNSTGAKNNCRERPNNFLEPVDSYYKFLISVKDPSLLVVSGIWTLPDVAAGGKVAVAYEGTGTTSADLNRATGLAASCTDTGTPNPALFGQAQFRLSKFAKLFGTTTNPDTNVAEPNATENSICNIGGYDQALTSIAKAIEQKVKSFCLPAIPKKTADGRPICLVGDVDYEQPQSLPDTFLPVCGKGCCDAFANTKNPIPSNPAIVSACTAEAQDCFCATASTVGECRGPDQVGYVAGVWRKGGAGNPSGKQVSFRCARGS